MPKTPAEIVTKIQEYSFALPVDLVEAFYWLMGKLDFEWGIHGSTVFKAIYETASGTETSFQPKDIDVWMNVSVSPTNLEELIVFINNHKSTLKFDIQTI